MKTAPTPSLTGLTNPLKYPVFGCMSRQPVENFVAEPSKSGWDRVFDELKSPWDWAAAFAGGAAGSLVTAVLHFGDMGHAVPTGALTAIAGRRAWSAGRNHSNLIRRANSLRIVMIECDRDAGLIERLSLLIRKAELKAISDDEFERDLNRVNEEDSK